jgi:predicted nicotinamide N-methyase
VAALLEERVELGGRTLSVLRPPDAEALLDEEAFEREEFLPYWAELWPSGLALARHVAGRHVSGLRVLELGCGLALPSLAAALGGARALATDWSPEAVALAGRNAGGIGLALETRVVDWRRPEAILEERVAVVLAADVLYERRNVGLLLNLLERLSVAGEILLADPGRPAAEEFFTRARERWTIETEADASWPRVELHTFAR